MRDYNKEQLDNKERKYAYNFDYDILHPFMLRAMSTFFRAGNLLELGSYQGRFTKRLESFFDEITCVEASEEAIEIAKKHITSSKIKMLHSTFENVKLDEKYQNIILTHVLEHVEDRIGLLKKINDEWLANDGLLYVMCPNANAASRQIAVKMNLIDFNSAITAGEKKHGHLVTYSFDTLEKDIISSGLKINYRTGIFFKALANFQWDKMIEQNIVSNDYFEGCYQLGQQYPELCASIFFVCEKGI